MIFKEETDYDPGWDYDVQKRPSPTVKKLVDSILRDLEPLKKELGFRNVYIHYIKAPNTDLARYINGTMDDPHFVLNARGIYVAAKEYGVNLGTTIAMTLTHEFGHAYLEMCGIDTHDHDENVVEEFARCFNDTGAIKQSIAILDKFVDWANKNLFQETNDLKTLRGSKIQRHQRKVGKRVGNRIYVHKNYMHEVIPVETLKTALGLLEQYQPRFKYNTVLWDFDNKAVRFDEAPDFDTAREPHVGNYVVVFYSGKEPPVKTGRSDSIWHHKWLWVKDDYKGFDVDKSKEWSRIWLSKLGEPAIGRDEKWTQQLKNIGFEKKNGKSYIRL